MSFLGLAYVIMFKLQRHRLLHCRRSLVGTIQRNPRRPHA